MDGKSRFVWHDLNTKDAQAAKRFYGELFGWRFEGSDGGTYLHIQAGEQLIGGVRQMEPAEQGPTSWLGYVGVDDVAACVQAATRNGGKVYMPARTMENVGTFAVVADPTGGVFAPWKSARSGEDKEPSGRPAPNTFCWDELLTKDADAATRFYSTTFGWGVEKVDMGEGMYTLLKRPGTKDDMGAEKNAGGIWKAPAQTPFSFWLPYVGVADADMTTEKARRLGASVMVPPTDIPNVGRFATYLDPQKAAIAVLAAQP